MTMYLVVHTITVSGARLYSLVQEVHHEQRAILMVQGPLIENQSLKKLQCVVKDFNCLNGKLGSMVNAVYNFIIELKVATSWGRTSVHALCSTTFYNLIIE